MKRPDHIYSDMSRFLAELGSWLSGIGAKATEQLMGEPTRLLGKGEYRAAVISAMTSLETSIRRAVARQGRTLSGRMSLGI